MSQQAAQARGSTGAIAASGPPPPPPRPSSTSVSRSSTMERNMTGLHENCTIKNIFDTFQKYFYITKIFS